MVRCRFVGTRLLAVLAGCCIAFSASSAPSAASPRTLSLAEQGHTDRIIIVWKGEAAKQASAAARNISSGSVTGGKAIPQAGTNARVSNVDPNRAQRLERIRVQATAAGHALKRDLNLTPHRRMADGAEVMKLGSRHSPETIAQLCQQLLSDPALANDIAEVLPDRLFFPQLTPNDPQYANQWALNGTNGINAPAAWDITTGNPNLVIGVLDTGKLEHADLAGRWIGGYDFVSLAECENDSQGDGIAIRPIRAIGSPWPNQPVPVRSTAAR